jgi:hypothetical protein
VARTSRTPPRERTTEALGPLVPQRKNARARLPRDSKHEKEREIMDDARIRRLIEIPATPAGNVDFERLLAEFDNKYGTAAPSEGGSTMEQDRMDEMVSERVERNERWGRDASRDEALAELVNEGAVPIWELSAPPRPRARTGSSAEVRDTF